MTRLASQWCLTSHKLSGSAHGLRRITDALTDTRLGWADYDKFEAYREKMLRYGIAVELTMEEPLRIIGRTRLC